MTNPNATPSGNSGEGGNNKPIPKEDILRYIYNDKDPKALEEFANKIQDDRQREAFRAAYKAFVLEQDAAATSGQEVNQANEERKREPEKKWSKKTTTLALAGMLLFSNADKVVKAAKDSGVFNGISLNPTDPIVEVLAESNKRSIRDNSSFYGESNPNEITINSEDRNEFGLEKYTSNEKLNSVLNQTGKQFYLPGLYNYEKDKKITPNAVANPKEIYKYMGVADSENPTIEESEDALKYVSYGQGFVSSGIATIFAGADKAPEGFTNNYDKNQEHVYSMEKGGEERLAHEEWVSQVFENSTFKRKQDTFSARHMYGNENKTGDNGEVLGVMTNGDSKLRNVIEQTWTDPETGDEITWEWQEECFNLGQTAKIKKKDGTVYYVTISEKPNTPITTTETPPGDNNPAPTPPEPVKKKDAQNLVRIDNNISQDISNNIGGSQVENYIAPEESAYTVTDIPAPESYDYTEPAYVASEESQDATPVEEVTPGNNYSNDLPPAVDTYTPVQENNAGQQEAKDNENTKPATAEEAANEFGFN